MSETKPRLATVEDLLALPDDETLQAELINGVLHTMTRPRPRHGHVQAALAADLFNPFSRGRGGPGGWWFLIEPFIRFGPHDATAPDLAGWRKAGLPEVPDTAVVEVLPDWICEVLSPGTALRDRTAKMSLYAGAGVGHLWIIDPKMRALEAFANHDRRWLRLGAWTDGDVVPIAPFADVTLDVGALFLPGPDPDVVAESAPPPWSASHSPG